MVVSFSGKIDNPFYFKNKDKFFYDEIEKIKEKENKSYLDKIPFLCSPGLDLVPSAVSPDEFTPIRGIGEYKVLLDKVSNEKTLIGNNDYIDMDSCTLRYRKDIPVNLLGAVIYAGYNDKSDDINKYLSGRLNYEELAKQAIEESKNGKPSFIGSCIPKHKSTYKDMVRLLDYSLKAIDEEYGKYKGIVYRQGYMDCDTPQFFSASKSAEIVAGFDSDTETPQYSVIKTKSGHKICDFQEEYGSKFAEGEQEILLDRKAKYRLVPSEEYDAITLKSKNKLENLLREKGCKSEVQVYEEI